MKEKIKINQEVILVSTDRRFPRDKPKKGMITKIGKKYFDVCRLADDGNTFGNPIKFEINGGLEKHSGYGSGRDWILYLSEQDRLDELEKIHLFNVIRKRFNVFNDKDSMELGKLREIANILGDIEPLEVE